MTTRMLAPAVEMWEHGATIAHMAKQLDVNRHTLASYIRKNRDLFPNRRHHADWWRSVFAECDGMTDKEIGKRYGVTESAVSKWRRELRDG